MLLLGPGKPKLSCKRIAYVDSNPVMRPEIAECLSRFGPVTALDNEMEFYDYLDHVRKGDLSGPDLVVLVDMLRFKGMRSYEREPAGGVENAALRCRAGMEMGTSTERVPVIYFNTMDGFPEELQRRRGPEDTGNYRVVNYFVDISRTYGRTRQIVFSPKLEGAIKNALSQ